jgi:heme-degrading monooxygenase HmoA
VVPTARRGEPMYGTVGRVKIKPENRDAFLETMSGQRNIDIPGFKDAYVLFPENRQDEAIMVVFFEDKDSYWKNANDPEQDKRYQEFSKYFESEPEWHDGEWIEPQ